MGRVFAIGDVQGCYQELIALLDKINYQPLQDQLWFVGDLINRGPDSLKTLRFIRDLPNTIVTLGNHDLSLLVHAYCGLPTRARDTIDEILCADDRDQLLTWLRQQKLFHFDTQLNTAMVHASVPVDWSIETALHHAAELEAVLQDESQCRDFCQEMFGNQPEQWRHDLNLSERLRFTTNAFTRVRYCFSDGRPDFSNKCAPFRNHEKRNPPITAPLSQPWFSLHERQARTTRIVFGHWSTLGLSISNNTVCLDTGCLWKGHLTAMRLDTTTPEFHQVPSLSGIEPF